MRALLFAFVSLIAYNCIVCLPVDKKLPPNANQKVEDEIDNLVSALFNAR